MNYYIPIGKVKEFSPDKIINSPGPEHPKYDTGNLLPIIREVYKNILILGINFGHQPIIELFGENPNKVYVERVKVGRMHGKQSKIFHDQETIFKDIQNPLEVIRYHSLAAKGDILPQCLKITATADDGTIMAV